ncbi:MAG: sulfatase [bacterium]|nr:sulfatase [bacterium]
MLLWVQQAAAPLELRLQADEDTAHHEFRVFWDGQELAAPAVVRRGGCLTIEIDIRVTSPGRHELLLKRWHRREPPDHREHADNVFPDISYRCGNGVNAAIPIQRPSYQRIAEFLQTGVAGNEKERRGGLLFVGPARTQIAITLTSPAELRIEPQNLSSQEAVFRLLGPRDARTTVAPGKGGELRLGLEVGEHLLTLEAQGDDEGLFLWGMPFLALQTARTLTPVILVTLDTTRRDVLDPYRRPGGDLTPHLTAFARQATVYENAYSTAPWTLPSHASMFTGLYPSKHGAGVSVPRLPSTLDTLARLLRRQGYLTAGFSAGELSGSRFGLAQGFHYFRDPDGFETPGDRIHEYVTAFLQRYGDAPLFLFINYFDPHALYRAPAAFRDRLRVGELGEKIRHLPLWRALAAGRNSAWRTLIEEEVPVTPEALAFLRASYGAEIAWTDHLVGSLFDQLRELNLFDRSLIVIAADHGELLGEGGYFAHSGRLDPELVEVPLLVKWPRQREGERVGQLVSLVDLFPTILAATGIDPPPNDGRALGPDAKESDPRSWVLLEEHASIVHPVPQRLWIAQHVYGVQRLGFRQLLGEGYQDCARRNGEQWDNVTCTSDLHAALEAVTTELGTMPRPDTVEGPVLDEVREALEALGYM